MEPSALSVPSTRTSFIPSAPRGVYANLLSCSRRTAQQRFDSLPKHTILLKHSNSCVKQPFECLSFSLQVYAATLEGDTIADNGAETASKSENGKSFQTAGKDSENGSAFQTAGKDSENGSAFQIAEDEGENGEVHKITGKESEKIEPSIGTSKNNYVPRRTGRFADREGKSILVPLDALKPGVILTGKVTNIAKFGAFVDVGAFTSGLIHITNLSNRFVSSVEDFLKVGEVVKVKVLNVDPSNGRLRLKLVREGEEQFVEKRLPLSDSSCTSERTPLAISKRSVLNAPGRPQKGEILTGSIAKIVSSGVFVKLTQGHEGFLPASEVLSSGERVDTSSLFSVGQQVPVRVLRTTRDRITLTMRKQQNTGDNSVDSRRTVLGSEEGRATSPFEIAFRRNEVIAKFLEEKERLQNLSKGNVEEDSIGESAQEGQ